MRAISHILHSRRADRRVQQVDPLWLAPLRSLRDGRGEERRARSTKRRPARSNTRRRREDARDGPAAPDPLASLAHADASADPLSAAEPSSLHATVVTKIMCASLSTDRVAKVASRMTTRPSLSPATRHPPSGERGGGGGILADAPPGITVQSRVFHRVACLPAGFRHVYATFEPAGPNAAKR